MHPNNEKWRMDGKNVNDLDSSAVQCLGEKRKRDDQEDISENECATKQSFQERTTTEESLLHERRLKNKQAAEKSRKKKKEDFEHLQTENTELKKEKVELAVKVARLKEHITEEKEKLEKVTLELENWKRWMAEHAQELQIPNNLPKQPDDRYQQVKDTRSTPNARLRNEPYRHIPLQNGSSSPLQAPPAIAECDTLEDHVEKEQVVSDESIAADHCNAMFASHVTRQKHEGNSVKTVHQSTLRHVLASQPALSNNSVRFHEAPRNGLTNGAVRYIELNNDMSKAAVGLLKLKNQHLPQVQVPASEPLTTVNTHSRVFLSSNLNSYASSLTQPTAVTSAPALINNTFSRICVVNSAPQINARVGSFPGMSKYVIISKPNTL